MIEPSMSLRFPAPSSTFCSSHASIPYYRPMWSLDDSVNVHFASSRISHSRSFLVFRNRLQRISGGLLARRKKLFRNRIRACAEDTGYLETGKSKGKPRYHPSEDIAESSSVSEVDARLTPAETTRTIIEVNSKATLLFSGLFSDEDLERIFWPELPYVTDEHGNMYFKVHHDEDILQSLASENNFVHVIMGLNNMEMFNDIDISGPAEIDFGLEDIEDEDIDVDDNEDDDEDDEEDDDNDFDEDWVSVLDEDDGEDSDESIGDWAKLETMRFSHPMQFAQKMAKIASDGPIDWMRKPPVGLCIHGFLTPVEDHSSIPKHRSDHQSGDRNIHSDQKTDKDVNHDKINGFKRTSESKDNSTSNREVEKDESSGSGISFYKLEMVRIQLLSPHGNPTFVEVDDFRKAKPDAIAHSTSKIVSHFQADGEKTEQALKSLCWRCKGIQVEEAALISVDSLGFDLRVCSGTQVQTLRFAFDIKATSEYSAERQLNDILFPRIQKSTRKKQPQQKETL